MKENPCTIVLQIFKTKFDTNPNVNLWKEWKQFEYQIGESNCTREEFIQEGSSEI